MLQQLFRGLLQPRGGAVLVLLSEEYKKGVNYGQLCDAGGKRSLEILDLAGSRIQSDVGAARDRRLHRVCETDGCGSLCLRHLQTMHSLARGTGAGDPERHITFAQLRGRYELHMRIEFGGCRQTDQMEFAKGRVSYGVRDSNREQLDTSRIFNGMRGPLQSFRRVNSQSLH